jgi:hypothetical protein
MGMRAMIDLYHRTTMEVASRIYAERRMASRENTAEAYFSTSLDGQASGYGEAAVHIRVPLGLAELEDEFPDGEQHYRVRVVDLLPEHFIGEVCQGCGRPDDPKADCLADLVDEQVVVLAEGRRVLSVNGQGHFPITEEG